MYINKKIKYIYTYININNSYDLNTYYELKYSNNQSIEANYFLKFDIISL